MIISFKDKETEKVWNQIYSKKLPREIQRIGLRKLIILHKAKDLNDLKVPPGNRLELLSSNREVQHSIRINNQWRICFRWNQGQIIDVEIVDYH
jgi:toxin HigB-1